VLVALVIFKNVHSSSLQFWAKSYVDAGFKSFHNLVKVRYLGITRHQKYIHNYVKIIVNSGNACDLSSSEAFVVPFFHTRLHLETVWGNGAKYLDLEGSSQQKDGKNCIMRMKKANF
jgi:hypothetical protein